MSTGKSVISSVIFTILLLAGNVLAYEPPATPVKEAILNGNVAFIGKIVKIEEIDDTDYRSTAIADVEIIQALYGLDSNVGKSVTVQFCSRLFSDYPYPGFPLELLVSDVVLFVFNTPQASNKPNFFFNSYWQNPEYPDRRIDLAFKGGDDPNDRFNTNKIDHYFVSAYMPGVHGRIKIKNLFQWASERAAEINRKASAIVEGN